MTEGRIDRAIEAVVRRFPDDAEPVRQLWASSQDFRDMCEELGEAVAAFERVGQAPPGQQAERMEECVGWIDRLAHEIGMALAEARVVRLRPRGPERRQ